MRYWRIVALVSVLHVLYRVTDFRVCAFWVWVAGVEGEQVGCGSRVWSMIWNMGLRSWMGALKSIMLSG